MAFPLLGLGSLFGKTAAAGAAKGVAAGAGRAAARTGIRAGAQMGVSRGVQARIAKGIKGGVRGLPRAAGRVGRDIISGGIGGGRGRGRGQDQTIEPVNVRVIEGFVNAVKSAAGAGGGGGAIVPFGSGQYTSRESTAITKSDDPIVSRLDEIKRILQRMLELEKESLEGIRNQVLNFARSSEQDARTAEQDQQETAKTVSKKEEKNPIVEQGKKAFGGIFDFLKNMVGAFIKYKILDWLSKPENTRLIKGTVQFFMNVVKLFQFLHERLIGPFNNLLMSVVGGGLNIFMDLIRVVVDLVSLKWLSNPKEFIDGILNIPKTLLEVIPNILMSLVDFITLGFFKGAVETIQNGLKSLFGIKEETKPEGGDEIKGDSQTGNAVKEGVQKFNPIAQAGEAIKGAAGTVLNPIGTIGNAIGSLFGGKKEEGDKPQLREGGVVGPTKGSSGVSVEPLDKISETSGILSTIKKTSKMFMDVLTMPFRLVGAALIALTMNTIGKIPGVGPFIKPLLQHIISKFNLPSSISNLVMGKSVDDKNQDKSKKSITSAKKPDSKSDGKRSVRSPGSGASPAPSSSETPGTPEESGEPGSSGTPGTPGESGEPGSPGTPGTGAPGELLVTNAKTTYYDPSLGGINASGIKTKDGLPATSTGEGYKPNIFSAAAFPPLLAKLPKNMTVSAQGFPGGRTLKTPFNSIVTNSAGKKAVVRVNDVGPGVQGHESNHMLDFSVATKNYLGTGTGFSVALAQSGSQPGPLNTPGKKEGGWITGPQTGYPVSLDGGSSASFIGHGTEWVGMKKSAGGDVRSAFVIPFDTPSTRSNGGLTQRRMKEAKSGGYHLPGFQGGGKVNARPASSTTGERTTDRGSDKGAGTGGLPAVITTGKLLLSKGFTVAEHPNFIKNSWSRPGPNTGTGYVSSGRASVGGHSSGSLHYKGLALDVTDWRDGDWPGRTKALAEEMYKNRNQLKLTQIIHDPWGSWFAGGAKGGGIGGHDTHLHLGFASGPGAENVDLEGGDSPAGGGGSGPMDSPTDSPSGGGVDAVKVEGDLKQLFTILTGKETGTQSSSESSLSPTGSTLSNVPNYSSKLGSLQTENLVTAAFGKEGAAAPQIINTPGIISTTMQQTLDTASLGSTLPRNGNWSIYKTNL
jgi:hypothetical protein